MEIVGLKQVKKEEGKFKIDLIVWKSIIRFCRYIFNFLFKIDLIVWKFLFKFNLSVQV